MDNNDITEYKPKTFNLYLENMFPEHGEIKDMSKMQINFFNKLFKNVKENAPHLLDNLPFKDEDSALKIALDKIIKKYNNIISVNGNLESEFNKTSEIAAYKKAKYSSSISKIGNYLADGKAPTLNLLNLSSNYFVKKK